jgi:membrane-associated phospholipid phosphatase
MRWLSLSPRLKSLLLLLAFSSSLAAPFAQAEEEARVPGPWEFVTHLPRDLRDFGSEILKPENRGLVAGILGITALTVKTDYESWRAVAQVEAETPNFRKFSNYGVSMGDGFFQFGIAGVFLATGVATGNTKAIRTTSQIVEAILATGIVVQVVKHISGRESPFSSESRTGVWRLFPDQFEYNKDFQKFDAVPSGHLSTATATYIVIYENYPDQKWIPYVGLPVLAWVSTGLVATSIHWWSDFPIALALGYSMGRIVTRENRGEQPKSAWTPMVLPTFSMRGEPMMMAGWEF